MIDVGVVGLVFFEVFVPEDATWPELGEETMVPSLPVGLGGALNTASTARALGLEVTLISPTGRGLTDRMIAEEVTRLGIGRVSWEGRDDAAITLVRSTPTDRAFISSMAEDALEGCPELPRVRWIHVGGLSEAERLSERLAEARTRGTSISVSANWDPDRLAALAERMKRPPGTPEWDLFFTNAKEAEVIGARDPRDIVGRLARNVVLSEGPNGARAVIGGEDCAVAPHAVDVVDPTGAGDALAAGVVSGLARGMPPAEALALGVRVAERVVGIRGGVVEPRLLADLRFSTPEKPGTTGR